MSGRDDRDVEHLTLPEPAASLSGERAGAGRKCATAGLVV